MSNDSGALRTPLHDLHVDAGGKMVEFAGWRMPVRYGSEVEEHRAVRTAAGLFDVSHMGEVRVHGPGALDFLQRATPNHVGKLKIDQAHYSALLTERATYVDDLLIYRLADDDFMLVVNAANIAADLAHLRAVLGDDDSVTITDRSADFALLALQGPAAPTILAGLTDADLDAIRYYHFRQDQEVAGARCLLSRTGYTGEEGFELYIAPDDAPGVWRRLLDAGAEHGLVPAGLACRDTLRLEAGMALYGHEIDDTTTPYEAGLGWTVKLKKGEFLGRDVLARQKEEGVERKLIGFELVAKGIPRQGYPVLHGGETVGAVTSGTWSPTLEKAIGTAYVPVGLAEVDTEIEIQVRKRTVAARVVPMPFYRRD